MGKHQTTSAAKKKLDPSAKKAKRSVQVSKKPDLTPNSAKSASFHPQTHPFVKNLADNELKKREDALKALKLFLQTPKEIPSMELLKLWRALFYSMWLSDRPLTQQQLADNLASLVEVVKPINFSTFLDAFWVIMAREWEGLDRYRLDKFYLLLRRYHAASLRRLLQEDWDEDWVSDYVQIMQHIPLNLENIKVPNGIRFHMFDIYLDELERVLKENDPKFAKGLKLLPSTVPEGAESIKPEFHTVDSDGEEESDSDESDSDDDDDDSDSEEDEGYIEETEEQKLEKKTKEQQEAEEKQAQLMNDWKLLAEKIKDTNVPLKTLLEPVERLAKQSPYSIVRKAAQEVLDDPRLIIWGVTEPPSDKEDEDEDFDDEEEFTGFD